MNEDSFYTNLSGGTDFLLLEKKRKSEINVNTPVTSLRSVCVRVRWDEEGWKGERDTKREPGPLKFWEKKWVKVMPFLSC